ncbi:synaptotagmin-1 [Bombina bombina]|uniref:synaptotagmin-1 n=1 Tax=Bombina bombina TaxID=8345 RepID=UPI00235AEEED|nr:synaptotagmin-1 [Bombina bombina]XP_053576460.1 synaptotagmin-1 [Bombina bombina]XP_053576461.1 synaptotagmin-1 [Bombina bombina]XP_053576462.1 synaptotagmin-1 [Bombina bombina]XP_053576463.1 synaptotagmin-1 [Bombina bombina]XP_053576464.1 synaptotagmin-1 [Bombina bombina]
MVNNSTNTVATTVHTFITSAPESWIDSILNRIPLPRWAIYALAGVAAFLILLIFICCLCCCCRRNSKQKKKEKISLRDAPATVTTSLVQPDLEGLVKAERNEYRGRLQYSLEYNFQKEEITVLVKQAASLKAMDSGGTSDPYVIVYLTNDTRKKHETKVYRKTLNPVFNESFNFQIPQSDIAETAVVLQVFDFNRFSKHDVIGEVRLPLGEVELQHVIEEWKELKPASKIEQERLGEICFSLRYVPSTSKLTVVILEAKKLKKMDSDGFSDPYVKVHLALNKKKWKRKKTTVKKNTLSPYFNEAFTFDVSLQQMQNIDLIISVWDHDKVNKNKQIGKLFLGCRASGNALRHWSDMLAHPRRPMAQWHNLQPAEEVDKTLGLKTKLKIPLPNS